jgi:HK97 gp10 family phage protein
VLEVKVEGLKELQTKLLALGTEYGTKAAYNPVRNALNKAARVVRDAAKQKVRRKTGTLAENIIATSRGKPDDRGYISAKVTVRAKAKAYKDNSKNRRSSKVGTAYKDYGPLFYARFLEFGTSPSKKRPWSTPPYPFLRPAFEENKMQLPELIRNELASAIERSVRKLKR